jgi:AcrR family transcriptional regulator
MRSAERVLTTSGTSRRDELIDLAAQMFDRTGYHQTSMAQLAAAAGVAKATLYHYFASKEQILIAIHGVFMDPLLDAHQRRLGRSITAGHLLLEAMCDIVELMRSHRGYVRVFFEHHRDLPEPERTAVAERRRIYQSMIQDVIEQGIAGGEFRTDINPGIAALTVFGACNWTYQWYDPTGPLTPRDVAFEMWKYIRDGLAVRPITEGSK